MRLSVRVKNYLRKAGDGTPASARAPVGLPHPAADERACATGFDGTDMPVSPFTHGVPGGILGR